MEQADMRSATSPFRGRDGGQQQIVSQVWKCATDDAGVVPEEEATNASKDRECPHLPRCAVPTTAFGWSAAAMCFERHSNLPNIHVNINVSGKSYVPRSGETTISLKGRAYVRDRMSCCNNPDTSCTSAAALCGC